MTKQRKYSVAEIDEMRSTLSSIASAEDWRESSVEDRLRTYMLNGTDPSELKPLAEAAWERFMENRRISEEQELAIREAMRTAA